MRTHDRISAHEPAPPPAVTLHFAELLDRARAIVPLTGSRRVLGLTGPPGAGKSTLADRLVHELGDVAVAVGMDGFHLAQSELRRLGRAERKGAPDTFDAAGYAELLRRARHETAHTVYAPMFRRDLEEPINAAIAVERSARLIVTEGNYLVLPDGAWREARQRIDVMWFLTVADGERKRRLVRRHRQFGKPEHSAQAHVLGTDEANAVLVDSHRAAADLVVTLLD